jgi:PAS domain S-box-containing protein
MQENPLIMSLRRKTLVIIGATLIGLVAILYLMSQTILLNSYAQLEAASTRRNVERTLNTLSDQLDTLSANTRDYAWWDDTYNFATDHNSDYMANNFVNSTFTNLEFNLLVILDANDQILVSKAVNSESGEDVPIPTGLDQYLTPNSLLLSHPDLQSPVKGVIVLPNEAMLVSSYAILDNQQNGPSHGSMIFGEFLDETRIQKLSSLLQLSISLYEFSSDSLPPEVSAARRQITSESPIFTTPTSSDQASGFGLVEDIAGNPALLMRIDLPRDIYHQGEYSVSVFLIGIGIVGLALASIMLYFIERTVLSRLRGFSRDMEIISQGGELSARLAVAGSDELSRLGRDVNRMLSALETTQVKLRGNDMQLRTVVQVAPILLWSTDNKGIVTLLEGKNLDLLGLRPTESIGKPMAEVFNEIPQLVQESRFALKGEDFSASLPVGQYVFDAHYVPLRKADGRVDGMIGVATDITEWVKAETALAETSQDLVDKNRQLENTRNLFHGAIQHIAKHIPDGAPNAEILEYLDFLGKQLDYQKQ